MNQKMFKLFTSTDISKVMFTIIQNPDLTITEIQKITKIPFSPLYRAIEYLKNQKLVSSKKIKRNSKRTVNVYGFKFSKINLLVDKNGVKIIAD